jgi:hypothetical protein
VDVVGSAIKIGWSKWSCADPATYHFTLWETYATKYQGEDRRHSCCSMNVLEYCLVKEVLGKF